MRPEIRDSLDHLFRRHAGQMVSALARRFGYQNIETVEDAVQDALVAAMKKWPFTGEPENARAWLMETAKNRLIDHLRRDGQTETISDIDEAPSIENAGPLFAGEIEDDELQMTFSCCHPGIPPDAQVALTLKTVGGFSVSEIARAFLSNKEAIAKMLTRAKAKLRDSVLGLHTPSQDELLTRRDAVLKVFYLMFNEGYAASEGDLLVRKDLCFEAIRLTASVVRHPKTKAPKASALLALFLFQAARLETRIDQNGELLLLEDQDRSKWNKVLLAEGLKHFQLSASGDEVSNYHLEAEIAAVHALSADFESTDWPRILECYDQLQRRKFSAVVELNRIVALQKISGFEAAIAALEQVAKFDHIKFTGLFHITRGHLLSIAGDRMDAAAAFSAAIELTQNQTVCRFLQRKIDMLRATSPSRH
jgi:RNA polymerase sigma-70 factor (ECF subfamily)